MQLGKELLDMRPLDTLALELGPFGQVEHLRVAALDLAKRVDSGQLGAPDDHTGQGTIAHDHNLPALGRHHVTGPGQGLVELTLTGHVPLAHVGGAIDVGLTALQGTGQPHLGVHVTLTDHGLDAQGGKVAGTHQPSCTDGTAQEGHDVLALDTGAAATARESSSQVQQVVQVHFFNGLNRLVVIALVVRRHYGFLHPAGTTFPH